MNGSRTTSMRKGYLWTALFAAVLLAASPGTALAQGVTITGPSNNTVNEGGTATYTVAIDGWIAAAASADSPTVAATVTVGLDTTTADTGSETAAEAGDISTNEGTTINFNVPANSTLSAVRFRQSQTIRIRTNPDADAENERVALEFELTSSGALTQTAAGGGAIVPSGAGTAGNPNFLIIDDDETQTYVLALSPANQKPTEGVDVTVSLKASPAHEDGSAALTLNIDRPAPNWGITIGGAAVANNAAAVNAQTPATGVAVAVTSPSNDRNRESDSVTLTVHSGLAGAAKLEDSLTITLADNNALQAVTAMVVDMDGKALDPQPTSVEEGASVKIAVMPVDDEGKVTTANEELEIELMASGSADSRDYRLSSSKIMITSGQNSSSPVDLTAETDEDVGMESLMFDATVSGEAANGSETSMSAGVLSLYIEDATAKKIEPKATEADYDGIKAAIAAGAGDEGLNPGETVSLMTSDLFDLADGYTASYGVSVDSDAVSASASGDAITINAVKAGMAHIVVTGTARMGSSSLEPSQTVSNVAELKFPVEVVDKPLTLTLEMPGNVMNGNIVEGSSYDIGVMANRMVTEAEGSVEVAIMRDRSQSDADDSDFSVSSATIMAGYDSATATLDVTEDMMDDAGHDAGEQLVLYGMSGDAETNALTFTIWDTAVPALPLLGQVALALFLMLGGARLYRRRQG